VDCPVERCGCTPGASLACTADQNTLCAADGHSTTTATCALGCSATEPRCLTFDPSNDLGGALADAATQPDIALPPGAQIDTDLGLIQGVGGVPIDVKSVLVSQNGGTSMIRVFEGRSFVIDGARVVGSKSLALVAPGPITIRGLFDASANGLTNGPGAQEAPTACAGGASQEVGGTMPSAAGAGGGGNATAGGAGGGAHAFGGGGGALIPTFVPLVGGCRGGSVTDFSNGTLLRNGGGGGGAVQLVSLDQIALTNNGVIDLGGGGGPISAGGGSGGTLVLEATHVRIEGATTGVVANGGAGGACGSTGPDGGSSSTQATGPKCSPNSAGDGATGTLAATSGEVCTAMFCAANRYGGGGGAAGRVRIATANGAFSTVSTPILSAVISTATLALH
jgi:hypothetical protein